VEGFVVSHGLVVGFVEGDIVWLLCNVHLLMLFLMF